MKIKFANPKVDKRVLKVFKSVLNSGIFVHGKFTKIFEFSIEIKKLFERQMTTSDLNKWLRDIIKDQNFDLNLYML